jgi:hypothetical protein
MTYHLTHRIRPPHPPPCVFPPTAASPGFSQSVGGGVSRGRRARRRDWRDGAGGGRDSANSGILFCEGSPPPARVLPPIAARSIQFVSQPPKHTRTIRARCSGDFIIFTVCLAWRHFVIRRLSFLPSLFPSLSHSSQAEIDAGTREGTPELLAAIANFTCVRVSECMNECALVCDVIHWSAAASIDRIWFIIHSNDQPPPKFRAEYHELHFSPRFLVFEGNGAKINCLNCHLLLSHLFVMIIHLLNFPRIGPTLVIFGPSITHTHTRTHGQRQVARDDGRHRSVRRSRRTVRARRSTRRVRGRVSKRR